MRTGECAVDAASFCGRAVCKRNARPRQPGLAKADTVGKVSQHAVYGETGLCPLFQPHPGAGSSQPGFAGAGGMRRLLEKAFKGGDGRRVGSGEQIDLAAQERVDGHVPVLQSDEREVGGIAGRVCGQRHAPAEDSGFFVAGRGIGHAGAMEITGAVDGRFSVAENVVRRRGGLIRARFGAFENRTEEDFIVDGGGLIPAVHTFEDGSQPLEKADFRVCGYGCAGGPAQRVCGLRPFVQREECISDALLYDTGELGALRQECAVGGRGVGVAVHAGQSFPAQEEAVDQDLRHRFSARGRQTDLTCGQGVAHAADLLERVQRLLRIVTGQVGQGEPVEDGGARLRTGGDRCTRPLGRLRPDIGQECLQQPLLLAIVSDPVKIGGLIEQGCRRHRLCGRARMGFRAARRRCWR